jgi:hypothetical protein
MPEELDFDCVDAPTFARWAMTNPSRVPFCTDCMPDYQHDMISLGRCRHHEVRFREDEHGFVEGFFPNVSDDFEVLE